MRTTALGTLLAFALTTVAWAVPSRPSHETLRQVGLEETEDSRVQLAQAIGVPPNVLAARHNGGNLPRGLDVRDRAGLEEGHENLGFYTWTATFGAWGPTRRALRRFDAPTQRLLQEKINQLMKLVVEYRGSARAILWDALPTAMRVLSQEQLIESLTLAIRLAERRMYVGRALWKDDLPNAARVLTPDQFRASLSLAALLVEHNIDPFSWGGFLHGVPEAMAKTLTPDQFNAGLSFATRLVEQGTIGPDNFFEWVQRGIPAAAKASHTLEEFQANLHALEELTSWLQQHPMALSYFSSSLKVVAHASPTSELFRTNLQVAARLSAHHRWGGIQRSMPPETLTPEQCSSGLALAARLAEQGVDPYHTMQDGLPVVAKVSPTPEEFQKNLQAMETFVTSLDTTESSRRLGSSILRDGFREIAQANPTSETFWATIELYRRFATRLLAASPPDWYGLAWSDFARLVNEAIQLDSKGLAYRIEVTPGQHYEYDVGSYEEYEPTVGMSGMMVSRPIMESVNIPQTIRLIPMGLRSLEEEQAGLEEMEVVPATAFASHPTLASLTQLIPADAAAAVLLRTVPVYRSAALAEVVDSLIQQRPETLRTVTMVPRDRTEQTEIPAGAIIVYDGRTETHPVVRDGVALVNLATATTFDDFIRQALASWTGLPVPAYQVLALPDGRTAIFV